MMYLFTFLPFSVACLAAVLIFRKAILNLVYIRKILWTVSAVSTILILIEGALYMSQANPDAKEMLYAIYINLPVVLLILGLSLVIQFMDFVNPK